MIIVTFTKLFAIKMVANVRSVLLNKSFTRLSHALLLGVNVDKSCGVKLKKAISEQLANPDNMIRKNISSKTSRLLTEGVLMYTSEKYFTKYDVMKLLTKYLYVYVLLI